MKLVGIDGTISIVLWSLYFMEDQGHKIQRAHIYHNNKSAILPEKNGRLSSSERAKHFKPIFFPPLTASPTTRSQ